MTIFFLLIGFIFLVKGAEYFVAGASAIGLRLKMPQIVIGLTIVSIGTSLPELFINVVGSIEKNTDIVLGNIIGSNIFNIFVILGLSSLVFPITATKNTVWKEIPFVILVTVLFFVLANDSIFGEEKSVVSRGDALILLVFMGFFVGYLYHLAQQEPEESLNIKILTIYQIVLFMVMGLLGLIVGGNWVVDSSIQIARYFQVEEKVIALTIISAGTGLPELVTSMVASFKKNSGIALGNVVGSGIFNIVLVIGISAFITPIPCPLEKYIADFTTLMLSAVVLFLAMFTVKKATITRVEAIFMLLFYLLYLLLLLYTV